MAIKITGGSLRGRQIRSPQSDKVRPTLGRVRESVFSRFQGAVADAVMLDCFAGSGIMGFEALSRCANQVVAVEKHPPTARLLMDNAEILGLSEAQYRVVCKPVERFCRGDNPLDQPFDVVFADPPYVWGKEQAHWYEWLQGLQAGGYLHDETLILMETGNVPWQWPRAESQIYGDTTLCWFYGADVALNLV